ncbi:MAG: serine/threonine protein kinase [Aureliella sp.]
MAKVTAEKLVELVEKSQLTTPEALEKALQAIREENGGQLPDDPVALAKALQRHNIVTHWHCEKLLQGRYKGFFLGKHKLLGHLGSGGMSSVYLAEHTKMHDKRAIKVLPRSRLGNSSYLARFQLEAKAIASLNHPNIVRAHDIDNEGDTHYIVMEYVDGLDLQSMVKKKGPLPFAQVADFIAQAARGLQHAHDIGMIHRDVKPANLLVNSQGKIKLLDLGLALFSDDSQASLTMDFNDNVLGTADYLAPEQALNSHRVDHRADIYGLGCTMYYLLTGSAPFPEGSIAQRIAKHQSTMPTEIRKLRPDCPGELEGICVKMIQKDPKFRYGTANMVADVLEAWRVKYVAEHKAYAKGSGDGGTGDSHLNLGEESSVGSGRQSASSIDTVSNRSSDTEAGRSSTIGSPSKLSTGDSGILMRIANKSSLSDASSRIDLEAEIRRRSAQSTGGGQTGSGQTGSSISRSSTGGRSAAASTTPSGRSPAGKSPAGKSPATKATPAAASAPRPIPTPMAAPAARPTPLPQSRGKLAALIIGLIVLLALAVAFGMFLAQHLGPTAHVVPPAQPASQDIESEDNMTPRSPRLRG